MFSELVLGFGVMGGIASFVLCIVLADQILKIKKRVERLEK